jgi:hypothetical protein
LFEGVGLEAFATVHARQGTLTMEPRQGDLTRSGQRMADTAAS